MPKGRGYSDRDKKRSTGQSGRGLSDRDKKRMADVLGVFPMVGGSIGTARSFSRTMRKFKKKHGVT